MMNIKEREALQDIADRLHLLLEQVNFDGTTVLYGELEGIVADLDDLLS